MENDEGFTLIELLMVVAVIGVIAAIAIPGLLRARMSANEASTIASLRAINSGEAGYSSTATRDGGYATTLAVLSLACPGGAIGFISPDLSADPAIKSGYTITLADGAGAVAGSVDCHGGTSRSAYYVTAVPLSPGFSGRRAFSTAAHGAIFFTVDGSIPPENGGVPIQ